MENNTTSSAGRTPRPPNGEERRQLIDWLVSQWGDQDTAESLADSAYVAVYDDYCTDCPGYAGKIMSIVWSGGPSIFDVFIWQDGKLVRSRHEFDDKECDECGAKNGTLCWSCWEKRSMDGTNRANGDTA